MTRLRLGQSGIRIQAGANFYLLKTSRLVLGPTQIPVQSVPGFLPGCTGAGQWTWPPTPSAEDKIDWRCTFSTSMVWTATIVTCTFLGCVMTFWANLAPERDSWRAVVNMMGNYPTRWASVVLWRPCWKEAVLFHQQFILTICNCDLCTGACGWGGNVSNSLYLESNNSSELSPQKNCRPSTET